MADLGIRVFLDRVELTQVLGNAEDVLSVQKLDTGLMHGDRELDMFLETVKSYIQAMRRRQTIIKKVI